MVVVVTPSWRSLCLCELGFLTLRNDRAGVGHGNITSYLEMSIEFVRQFPDLTSVEQLRTCSHCQHLIQKDLCKRQELFIDVCASVEESDVHKNIEDDFELCDREGHLVEKLGNAFESRSRTSAVGTVHDVVDLYKWCLKQRRILHIGV